jgi:hypothetical protein
MPFIPSSPWGERQRQKKVVVRLTIAHAYGLRLGPVKRVRMSISDNICLKTGKREKSAILPTARPSFLVSGFIVFLKHENFW